MIEITDSLLIGTGTHRKCYRHPQDPGRCIKILHEATEHEVRGIDCEVRYYRHLARTLKDWSGIPRYFGTVETSRGTGHVFELITNADGSPCIGMDRMIEECASREDALRVLDLLGQLRRYLFGNTILVTSLNLENVLCRRLADGRCVPVICDNIGERSALPLTFWIKALARRKENRYWRKAMEGTALTEMLARYGLSTRDLL